MNFTKSVVGRRGGGHGRNGFSPSSDNHVKIIYKNPFKTKATNVLVVTMMRMTTAGTHMWLLLTRTMRICGGRPAGVRAGPSRRRAA